MRVLRPVGQNPCRERAVDPLTAEQFRALGEAMQTLRRANAASKCDPVMTGSRTAARLVGGVVRLQYAGSALRLLLGGLVASGPTTAGWSCLYGVG